MKFRKILYLLIMIGFIYGGYRYINYKNSTTYKLKDVGYSNEEIKIIDEKLDNSKVDHLLQSEYNNKVAQMINAKYFIEDKLEAYLNYQKENSEHSTDDVISIVNAGADKDFYTDVKKADTSKGYLILVNKFYELDKNFTFDDIVPISLQHAYSGRSIRKEVLDNFIDMWQDAQKLDLSLIVSSGYRDYNLQESLYTDYSNIYGQEEADTFSARPGYSEHQTGLALDIAAYGSSIDDFEKTKEYEWLKDNAHHYGFILRYPINKTHITGYDFEPWHYRYVGKEVAKEIYELDITFDEYYELFIK